MDPFGMEARLQPYERRLEGGADAIRGSYEPDDEGAGDPEKRVHWSVFYRVL